MRNGVLVLSAAVVGLVVGAGVMLGIQQPAAEPLPLPSASTQPVKQVPVPHPEDAVLLVWTSGGLPSGLDAAIAGVGQVERTTTVRGDLVELVASRSADGEVVDALAEGFVIALDAIALDAGFSDFVPASTSDLVADLATGEALLSRTSAQLRRTGAGGTLSLASGHELRIAGVVDDEVIGGAELAVSEATGTAIGVVTPRYVLVRHRGDRAAVETAVRDLAPGPVRIRGPGETPFLRHGDAVLPQAAVKQRFGEFSYRRLPGTRDVVQEAEWAREHIVTIELPLLGTVRCHRTLVEQLTGALRELDARNLGWLIQPEGFAGCHAARYTSSRAQLSRHAWGIAVDINVHKNPMGAASAQDPRLVEVFQRWGFTWGGEWLVPDAGHFEYLQPPRG